MPTPCPPSVRDRVLALDPTSRGFGFVVIEDGPLQLVDWGVRHCAREQDSGCAMPVRRLIARYEPTTIVLEDAREARSMRAVALEAFVADIGEALIDCSVELRTYTRSQVRGLFSDSDARTKEEIAKELVSRFPELRSKEPPHRKVWESEDSRMAIFDALSFALVHLYAGAPE